MIDLSKLKVGADVICDDDDDADRKPKIALYYDHDPDDPTPLFGDVSADAMAIEMMLYEGTLDRGVYAAIERMRCADHVTMVEYKTTSVREKAKNNNGPQTAGEYRTREAEEFWAPWVAMYKELLKKPRKNETPKALIRRARKTVAARIKNRDAWFAYRPKSETGEPDRGALKKWLI